MAPSHTATMWYRQQRILDHYTGRHELSCRPFSKLGSFADPRVVNCVLLMSTSSQTSSISYRECQIYGFMDLDHYNTMFSR